MTYRDSRCSGTIHYDMRTADDTYTCMHVIDAIATRVADFGTKVRVVRVVARAVVDGHGGKHRRAAGRVLDVH